jgi:AAA15 family ATPase/GTPase
MIQIRSLEITNYRSCIKTKVEINTSLTALIGANGVGKSNILNSIQLLKRINRNRYFHQKEFQESLSSTNLKFNLLIDDVPYILKADIFYETDESNTENIYSARLLFKRNTPQTRKWTEIDADLYEVVERLKYFKSS